MDSESDSSILRNTKRDAALESWKRLFNFITDRKTIIASCSLSSLVILLIIIFIVFNRKSSLPKINNVRSAFSSVPYDLCPL